MNLCRCLILKSDDVIFCLHKNAFFRFYLNFREFDLKKIGTGLSSTKSFKFYPFLSSLDFFCSLNYEDWNRCHKSFRSVLKQLSDPLLMDEHKKLLLTLLLFSRVCIPNPLSKKWVLNQKCNPVPIFLKAII